jgi:solute carrier family 12 sodium/potassium/chloride transporter 2
MRKFSTFSGVIVPDVLTILGVIMYLRLGWVVGNTGLLGAITIILLAKSVTLSTGLSMASITTNIRIGAGGAYSIIAKSLGLEAGGSIGIPFYISQTLSVALYIIGFAEGWLAFFPGHSLIIVSFIVWIIVSLIAYISARFAIRVQYIILAIITFSLVSFFLGGNETPTTVHWQGSFERAGFWVSFAIFFPAVTGIMAGANLSGELQNPRRSIPVGTLTAIGLTTVIYLAIAIYQARVIPVDTLINNPLAMVEHAFWGPLVTLGILAATFSSALSSMVGSPRILQALASHNTVPFSAFFKQRSKLGEPRNALVISSMVVGIALFTGNLNSLASLITMFFLITYGMLNLVVLLQKAMRIISFRPTFKVPTFVSLYGSLSCLLIMMLIDPIFSVIALITIIALYYWLSRRKMVAEWGDIRGGFLLALAERASAYANRFPRHKISWKPDLLLPVETPAKWHPHVPFLTDIISPSGSLYAFTVKSTDDEHTARELQHLFSELGKANLTVSSAVVPASSFIAGAKTVLQTLRNAPFRPNTLFLRLGREGTNDAQTSALANYAAANGMGILMHRQVDGKFEQENRDINIWLRTKSPNWNLALLTGIRLQANWNGRINLLTATADKNQISLSQNFLNTLIRHARLPANTELHALEGTFPDVLTKAPQARIHLFGMADFDNLEEVRRLQELIGGACLFVRDSGEESALV